MERILIVDDEKSIRFTLNEFLSREGYQSAVAEDVESAINLIETECFDIVISDILMPKKTGIDLLEFVLSKCPQTKVIMITGEPNVQTAAQAIRLGACDYLNKPVNKDSVLKSVNNALKIKNLEDENRQYQSKLEKLVEVRTNALELALKEKEKMQQQIIHHERMKGLCLVSSGIAHNINNTISPIFMYSEALLEKNVYLDNESKQYIYKIISAAEEIENIVLKIEDIYASSNQSFQCSDQLDTSEIIRNIASSFTHNIKNSSEKKEININIETSENLPEILFEKNTLEDVLKAIMKNSVESIKENGTIDISNTLNGNFLAITIKDDGIGMDEYEIEHCCDPFFTTKGPQATGLGLSGVYGTINRNQGRMEISSEIGKGTSITIYLPVNINIEKK